MTHRLKLAKPNTTQHAINRMVRRLFRLLIARHSTIYDSYARYKGLKFRLTDSTQLVVDSYPRSANSFFEAALTKAHGGLIEVAHHSHAAGQVLAGVKRGLPCVVLIRQPEAAISSFYEMNGGHYPLWLCISEYTAFYKSLLPALDRLIVVPTESLEDDFYRLMVFLRDRYGVAVDPYEINATTRTELLRVVDATGRARNGFAAERYSETLSVEEKAKRNALLESIREMIRTDSNRRRLTKAYAVYARFIAHAF